MRTLLLADHDHTKLNPVTAKALTAALQLGAPVDVVVAGSQCQKIAEQASTLQGVEKVLLAEGEHLRPQLAEDVSTLILSLMDNYKTVLTAATTTGKNVMPRIAARLDVAQVSDITAVLAPDTFERPIYAGNALQTVQTTDAKQVITVRTTCFAATSTGGSASIERLSPSAAQEKSNFVRDDIVKADRPELTAASVIVSGGRGLGSKENFAKYIEPLALELNAAIGASRAAVDAGYVSNDLQVGQTGKAVAPELYIAIGISGAIQHLAGMKESKIIVAINKDEDAAIFQVADYGLVGDLFTLLPEFLSEIKTFKK